MKDERRVLTREIIKQKLIFDAKRSIFSCTMSFVISSAVLGLIYAILSFTPSISSKAPQIAVAVIFAGVIAVYAFFLVRAVLRMDKAKHGEFSVDLDILEDVKDDVPNKWYFFVNKVRDRGYRFEHIFLFKSGKRFKANKGEYLNTSVDTTAKISNPGDTFILVSYNDAPEKIVFLFSEKLYNYTK